MQISKFNRNVNIKFHPNKNCKYQLLCANSWYENRKYNWNGSYKNKINIVNKTEIQTIYWSKWKKIEMWIKEIDIVSIKNKYI